ncbi:unnamed protein product [Adineta steineri]|uniref:Uncharacterized protein n=2 Tax=Adineta steineri TaxID=433720 RepID=A0A813N8H5_9BILA|nr:unnamed protein product [Adineta steineri]
MFRNQTPRKIFIQASFFTLFLLIYYIIFARSQNVTGNYVITKDFFTILKAGQFSVYNSNEQQLQHRIQSQIALWQIIELVSYPSNQVIAKLHMQWLALLYNANISIFDSSSNQWINGRIRRHFQFFGDQYTIEWNGQSIVMETKIFSLTTKYHYQNQETILAQFHRRWISLIWTNKYDLEIFSKEIPDAIYILALAAKDHNTSQSSKSSKSTRKTR